MWYVIDKMSRLLVIWMHSRWWFSGRHNLHGLLLLILLWACSGLLNNIWNQVSTSSAILWVVEEAIHGKVGPCWVATLGMRILLLHNWCRCFDLFFWSLGSNWVWSNCSHICGGDPTHCTLNLFDLRMDVLLLTATNVLNVYILIPISHSCWILSLSGLTSSVFCWPKKCSEEVSWVIIRFPALIQILDIFFGLAMEFLISRVYGIHILRVEVHSVLVLFAIMLLKCYWLSIITHFMSTFLFLFLQIPEGKFWILKFIYSGSE